MFDPKAFTQESRAVWDQASSGYDQKIAGRFFEFLAEETVAWAGIQKGERILEVACGSGIVTLKAAKKTGPTGRITAVDFSPEMVKLARKKTAGAGMGNIELLEMDAQDLKFKDESFDLALCQLGLMLFADPDQALKEMRRVLKPGARLVAAVQGTAEKMIFTSAIQKAVIKRAPHLKVPGAPTMYMFGPQGALEDALSKAGFQKIETKRLAGTFSFKNFEDYWETVVSGAGKTRAMFESLPPEDRKAVYEEVGALVQGFQRKSGVEIPYEFVLAKGCK